MAGLPSEQLQEPQRGRRHRRLAQAFASPDSYGLVLLLILLTYVLSATLAASWADSLVLAVQITTVWVTLRASRARQSARTVTNVALATAALPGLVNLVVHAHRLLAGYRRRVCGAAGQRWRWPDQESGSSDDGSPRLTVAWGRRPLALGLALLMRRITGHIAHKPEPMGLIGPLEHATA
jgi:hypothetical protein